jgi:hypothetical protein
MFDRSQIIIYNDDNGIVGAPVAMILRLYYNSSHPRDYPFNITFIANTRPYFATPITEIVIN